MDGIRVKQLFFSLFALVIPDVSLVFRMAFWSQIDHKKVKYRAKNSDFNGVKLFGSDNWFRSYNTF